MRRGLAAGGLAVLLLALTGCVGIPLSGGVNQGGLIEDQLDPEIQVLPEGPRAGSTPEELLRDFMQAVRGPQNGYEVAKEFLTTEFGQSWKPDAIAIIRTGADVIASTATDTLSYTYTSRASVDDQGRYTEQRDTSTQTVDFTFVKVGEEWRIASGPEGVVLSAASFMQAFTQEALYFFDPSYSYLVPDVRWFPSRPTTSRVVVEALLLGPSPWLGQGAVVTAFPESTKVGNDAVRVQSGTTVVDLTQEVIGATPQQQERMRQQLVATLDTPNLQLTVRGAEITVPAASADGAQKNPTVAGALLVGTGDQFGFIGGGAEVSPLTGLSGQVTAAGSLAATLSSDAQAVAVLDAAGAVAVARVGDDAATVLDTRPALVVPSIDPFKFVWSASSSDASSLITFELDGTPHDLQSGLPADSRIVSVDVSRDGARVLIGLDSPVGPQVLFAGVIRQDNVPVRLGDLQSFPVSSGDIIDATWVDDRSVAVLAVAAGGEGASITQFALGGPSVIRGSLEDATAIVGGNGGVDGLRVLRANGEVWRPQGSGWVSTGVVASFIATKQ